MVKDTLDGAIKTYQPGPGEPHVLSMRNAIRKLIHHNEIKAADKLREDCKRLEYFAGFHPAFCGDELDRHPILMQLTEEDWNEIEGFIDTETEEAEKFNAWKQSSSYNEFLLIRNSYIRKMPYLEYVLSNRFDSLHHALCVNFDLPFKDIEITQLSYQRSMGSFLSCIAKGIFKFRLKKGV